MLPKIDCFTNTKRTGLAITVYVQPRASNNRIAGLHGKALKVYVTAPPVEDKANTAVIHLFADLFRVPRSAVSIKSGKQARNKKVFIKNLALEQAEEILSRVLPKT
jgi:uncharacterized protein (TIGR00251 family)